MLNQDVGGEEMLHCRRKWEIHLSGEFSGQINSCMLIEKAEEKVRNSKQMHGWGPVSVAWAKILVETEQLQEEAEIQLRNSSGGRAAQKNEDCWKHCQRNGCESCAWI